jgi:hypothetical protein
MNDNQFVLDGLIYQIQFNELHERGGCCQLDGRDMIECEGCNLARCPTDGEKE